MLLVYDNRNIKAFHGLSRQLISYFIYSKRSCQNGILYLTVKEKLLLSLKPNFKIIIYSQFQLFISQFVWLLFKHLFQLVLLIPFSYSLIFFLFIITGKMSFQLTYDFPESLGFLFVFKKSDLVLLWKQLKASGWLMKIDLYSFIYSSYIV